MTSTNPALSNFAFNYTTLNAQHGVQTQDSQPSEAATQDAVTITAQPAG